MYRSSPPTPTQQHHTTLHYRITQQPTVVTYYILVFAPCVAYLSDEAAQKTCHPSSQRMPKKNDLVAFTVKFDQVVNHLFFFICTNDQTTNKLKNQKKRTYIQYTVGDAGRSAE